MKQKIEFYKQFYCLTCVKHRHVKTIRSWIWPETSILWFEQRWENWERPTSSTVHGTMARSALLQWSGLNKLPKTSGWRWTERETTAAGGRIRPLRRPEHRDALLPATSLDTQRLCIPCAQACRRPHLHLPEISIPQQTSEADCRACLPDSQRKTGEAKLSFSKMLPDISELSSYNFKICKWQERNQLISPMLDWINVALKRLIE